MRYLLLVLITLNLYAYELNKEEYCLAQNIYYEARSSNLADQYAVADVVLNRISSIKYPNTICSVVKQAKLWKGNPIRNQCQFSWYCDGRSDKPKDTDAWIHAQFVALNILKGNYLGISNGATHYHADYVHPYWVTHMEYLGQIGAHKFYKLIKE